MPDTPLLLVKLGGAALTDKAVFRSLRVEALQSLACDLSQHILVHGGRCVIMHGAGSFGHYEAAAAKLSSSDPAHAPLKTPLAIAACRASLLLLHSAVVDALVAAGVPAASVNTYPNGLLGACEAVELALRRGFVPVLHGDLTLSRVTGTASGGETVATCSVMSGDTLMSALAAHFGSASRGSGYLVQRAIYVTGVDSVYTHEPTCATSMPERVSRILVTAAEGGNGSYSTQALVDGREHATGIRATTSALDATGGLEGKLREAAESVWARSRTDGAAALSIRVLGVADFGSELAFIRRPRSCSETALPHWGTTIECGTME